MTPAMAINYQTDNHLPQLFRKCVYSVQNAGIPQGHQLACRAKLDNRGANFVADPEDSRVHLIFVFPPQDLTQIEYEPAWHQGKSLHQCRQQAIWEFDGICFHLGRTKGDKNRKRPYILDAAWVDDVVEQGVVLNKQRWGLHEIVVKRNDSSLAPAVAPSPIIVGSVTVDPMTPLSMLSTPNESTSAKRQTSTLPQSTVDTSSASSSRVVEQGSELLTDLAKSFYVHTMSLTQAALQTAITSHGGIIRDIKEANYILVDGTKPFPTRLYPGQIVVSVTWLEQSLGLGAIQDIEGYTLGSNQDLVNEPALEQVIVKSEPTLPTNPVQATPEETSVDNTSVQDATAINQSTRPQSGKPQRKERLLNQIVRELVQWSEAGCKGSRTAFLRGINKTEPGHDRISIFKRNRTEILDALSKLGHDISEGSKLYGGHEYQQGSIANARQIRADLARSKRSRPVAKRPRTSSRVPASTTTVATRATATAPDPPVERSTPLLDGASRLGGLTEPLYRNVLPDEWFLHPAWGQ